MKPDIPLKETQTAVTKVLSVLLSISHRKRFYETLFEFTIYYLPYLLVVTNTMNVVSAVAFVGSHTNFLCKKLSFWGAHSADIQQKIATQTASCSRGSLDWEAGRDTNKQDNFVLKAVFSRIRRNVDAARNCQNLSCIKDTPRRAVQIWTAAKQTDQKLFLWCLCCM